VVCEATGSWERQLVGALASTGLPIVVVNPRQVRDFAKATGRLANTDRLDAEVIAHFAEAVHPDDLRRSQTAVAQCCLIRGVAPCLEADSRAAVARGLPRVAARASSTAASWCGTRYSFVAARSLALVSVPTRTRLALSPK
jgi:hypothetical protein